MPVNPSTPHRSSDHTPATKPVRGAARNQELVDQADPASEATLFPTLEQGLVLLDTGDTRAVPILHSMVVDHLLLNRGPAFWVDANGHATTTTLAQIAPSRRLLDRIHVARGFTAYQHYAAVADISSANTQCEHAATEPIAENTAGRPSAAPSLIIAPTLDANYRSEDSLPAEDAATLQARTLAQLSAYAADYEIPVLVTRSSADDVTTPIATAADQHIECEQTDLGPRFVGDDFETQVYPVAGGRQYQTTLAYWQQLLAARASHLGLGPSETEPTPSRTEQTPSEVGNRGGGTATLEASVQGLNPAATAWPSAGEW